jgi:AraC family transcriptional regulator, positive regulator of tynA and feaB
MSVEPFDALGFRGQMRPAELSEIRAVDILSEGARVHRTAQHVARTREAVFTLDVQLRGESIVRQAGREAHLRPGDFVLTDSTRPYSVTFEQPVVMRLMRVPAKILRRYVGCPEDLVGVRVDGREGPGRVSSRLVRTLWKTEADAASMLPSMSQHIERATLELLASAYAQFSRTVQSSLATLHRMQIVEAIEASLEDPGLTPAKVAESLRISARYLHRLFSTDGETVSRYILRRRLENCAVQLKDPRHDRRQVGDIAFGAGFSTSSHFCRTFRDHFGLSPGEYREQRGQAADAARRG